mmetsp:Transcript_1830/g.1791  ORF Transcript_1830/g.1791 Transcript_1830/m.1791 type:complete len:102 (-) Transcript_1830:62-367(-)
MLSCCRLFLPLSFMAVFCAVVTQWLNSKWTAKTGIPACSWPYNVSMWTWIACATLTTNFQTRGHELTSHTSCIYYRIEANHSQAYNRVERHSQEDTSNHSN